MSFPNPFDFTGKTVIDAGAIPRPIPPEHLIDLGVVAAVERKRYFETVLGLGSGAQS